MSELAVATASALVQITPTRAELAARCFRRHAVADVLSMRPRSDSAPHRDFGKALHAACAAHWKLYCSGERTPARLTHEAERALEAAWLSSIAEDSNLTLELGRFLARHYALGAKIAGEHWAGSAAWELVACEERIALDLGDGVVLTFQLDRLVRCTEGDPTQPIYVVVDTKSAGRLGSYWHRTWPTSLQQKCYHAAVERHFGIDLAAHYIEGVLKNVPCEIVYAEVHWSDGILEEALDLAKQLALRDAALLRAAEQEALRTGLPSSHTLREAALRSTLTNAEDCFAYNRKCELYELCHFTEPEQRSALLQAEFVEVARDWQE